MNRWRPIPRGAYRVVGTRATRSAWRGRDMVQRPSTNEGGPGAKSAQWRWQAKSPASTSRARTNADVLRGYGEQRAASRDEDGGTQPEDANKINRRGWKRAGTNSLCNILALLCQGATNDGSRRLDQNDTEPDMDKERSHCLSNSSTWVTWEMQFEEFNVLIR